jgi:hypothetical protein
LNLTSDEWRRGALDPAYFASAVLNVDLHPGQRLWLENSHARENLLVTGNRWGKSFVSAVKLIHHALYRVRPLDFDRADRYRAVVASITQDQANLVFHQVLQLLRRTENTDCFVENMQWRPFPKIAFGNGATIEARSTQNRGEHLLGNDFDLFIFDEVAFEQYPEYVVEEVVLMRLADREGKLDLVSTPNGKNWFYTRANEIMDGRRPGYFQSGDSRDNCFISRHYLDERVEHFSESRLQQNIMGQFVDSGGEILTGAAIDAALALEKVPATFGEVGVHRYISGWDLARKKTATVGITVEVVDGTARVVALERFKNVDWTTVIARIEERQRKYPGELVIDSTGLGDVVADQLAGFHPVNVIFTPATKAELLTHVELCHAQKRVAYGRWELPDGPGRRWSLEDELRRARWDNNSECDALMALGLALWPLRTRTSGMIAPRIGKIKN